MKRPILSLVTAAVVLAGTFLIGAAPRSAKPPKKKVLVELFTSQG